MSKYIAVLSFLALLLISIPVLAINNQPVSSPVAKPVNKIFECEGPPIILDGSNSFDQDGDPLRFDWYRGTSLYAQGKTVKVTSDIVNKSETYIFTLKVTDDEGSSDSRDVALTVVDNPMPNIESLKYSRISGARIKERNFLIVGDIFQLEAVKGKSSRIKNYIWKYDEKVFQMIGNGSVVKFKVISDSFQSNQEIKVTAFNACGVESNRMEKNLVLRSSGGNSPPTSLIEPPSKIYEGKRFQMFSSGSKTGQGFNEQGDKIVKWRWEIRTLSGSVLFRSDVQNPTFTIENSGIFTVYLWVTDSFGATADSNTTFSVIEAENDPSVADASATSRTAIFGQNFTLNGTKSWDLDGRPEDAISRYEWYDMTYDPKNGDKLCGSSRPTCVVIFNRTGIHNIRLKVFDAGALGGVKISDITINVIPPSQNLPQATNGAAEKEQPKIVPTSGVQEAPINPEEVLRRSPTQKEEEFPIGAKPAPGMEVVIAIISILAIAIKRRN
ncbi:MAG: hypothetical protein WA063_05525 [Minisyncoccia bacterium]